MAATADSLAELGNYLADERRWAEAAEAYRRAAAIDPNWSAPWYNLGLIFKSQSRWEESLEANHRATQLNPEDCDAWWNLGIAATALDEWAMAREAWTRCGIDIPAGAGPLNLDYGHVPIRLNPQTEVEEVVWTHRIDPARAVLLNVPFARSGYCEGDTVLHDGAPNGYRVLDSKHIPVFDSLDLLEMSPRRTTESRLTAESPTDMDALVAQMADAKLRIEDWTSWVSNLCKLCSEGLPHEPHEAVDVDWQPERHVGVSTTTEGEAVRTLRLWAEASSGRSIVEVKHHGMR